MSTITCGNCHETHESVAAVRACYESAGGITTPTAEPTRTVEPLTEGMYKVGDTVYKVQVAVHGSGHLYAKRLEGGRFEYAPGMMKRLRPEDKMTLEEAKAWGVLYGTCCVCGRTLTDEDSIAAGIGPVCAGKEGWWR